MKYRAILVIILGVIFSVSACRIRKAKNELEDAMEDAFKTEGADACEDILDEVYSALDSCSEEGVLTDGQTSYDAALTWCENNCTRLSTKIDDDEFYNCSSAVYALDCDTLGGMLTLDSNPSACNWLEGDLGC